MTDHVTDHVTNHETNHVTDPIPNHAGPRTRAQVAMFLQSLDFQHGVVQQTNRGYLPCARGFGSVYQAEGSVLTVGC